MNLQDWLSPLDTLPLECDGMTRVISALLEREGIDHQAYMGSLVVPHVGRIGLHAWIDVEGDPVQRIDLRARMWLGEDARVPHGVFEPSPAAVYDGHPFEAYMDPIVLQILCGKSLDDFDRLAPKIKGLPRP